MSDQLVRAISKDGFVKAAAVSTRALTERARQIHKLLPVGTAALGRTAADKLIELIEHPRVTLPEQIRVSGKLLDGGSVSIL